MIGALMTLASRFAMALAYSLLLSILGFAQNPAPTGNAPFDDLLARAQSGDPAAQLKLADAYLGRAVQTGVTVQPDYSEAVRWFLAAAKQNNQEALLELGWGYENGFFGPKDGTKAAEYYRRAAELGNKDAPSYLTNLYTEGAEGLPRNFDEAARWAHCPKPSGASMESCREITADRLPKPALALLSRLKCDAGSNYDYGTKMHLGTDSDSPSYVVCCHDSPHGPCSAVLIGKEDGTWTNLTPHYGLFGFDDTCGGLMILESAHARLHDLCLPTQCSTSIQGRCLPEILEMQKDGYQPASSTPAHRPNPN
jgi:hypothetical protein